MKKEEREAMLREHLAEMKKYENEIWARGIKYIAGVDEVGRGPLAGPVVAAAVVLPQDFSVIGVDDSKKLSAKKREELFGLILENALAVGIGMRNNKRIDEINILEATKEAMADAVAEVQRVLGSQLGYILFDAMKIDSINIEQTSLIKGDTKSVSIAAASIIAKVTRDRMMVKYAEEYPDYAFEKNKGYGTKAHYEGISRAGICPIHRKTFLKNIIS